MWLVMWSLLFSFSSFSIYSQRSWKTYIHIYRGKNVCRVWVEPLAPGSLCMDLKLIWTEHAVPNPAWSQLTILHINTLTIERSRVTWDPLPFIIKQLSCLLRNGRSVPSSYGLVSCEQLYDSRSPHNRGGQLEVLAEAGFVLSARPSGKEQDSKADGEVKKSAFPSARQRRDLCYAICERTCTFSLRLFWHFSLPISCPRHLQGPAERFSHPWWRFNALAHQL